MRGMSWDMTAVLEHRIEIAGHATRALEVDGDGPGHRPAARLERLRRHLAAAAGGSSPRATGARSRSTCPASARRRRLQRRRGAPAAGRVRARPRRRAGRASEPVVVAGTSLGGCLALRLAEHPGDVRLAGVVPVAPDGLELPSWFDPIEEDPIVRRLLSIPVPVPGVLVRRAQVERLPAARVPAPERDAARRRRRLRPQRRDPRGRRGAARVRPPARARALDRAVRPDRHPLPGAARVGRARPDAPAHATPGWRSIRCRRPRSS